MNMPVLGGLAAALRWCEDLIALVSGPALTVGLGIALIDLLTDGGLLRSQPELLYAYAVSMAVGVDAQLVGAWDRAGQAIRERRWFAVVGLVVLGCVLGYFGFLSAQAFGFEQAFGLTEADALARLGIDPISWQLQRAALAVVLVALSGFNRVRPAPKPKKSLEAERAELEREIALAPLRQRVRAQKALGAVALAKSVLRGEKDVEAAQIADKQAEDQEPETPEPEQDGKVLKLVPDESYETRARRLLQRNPKLTNAELTRLLGCSPSTAARLRRKILSEVA